MKHYHIVLVIKYKKFNIMKNVFIVSLIFWVAAFSYGQGNNSNPPTNFQITKAFKEVFIQGLDESVSSLGKPNGYYGSAKHKININSEMRKVTGLVSLLPAYSNLDSILYAKMNNAAEVALPKIKSLVRNKITNFKFDSPMQVVMGNNNAASLEFQTKTYDEIFNQFKVYVNQALNENQGNKYWDLVYTTYKNQPNATNIKKPVLFDIVSQQALNCIFVIISEDEIMMRENPYARSNDNMKKVLKLQDKK